LALSADLLVTAASVVTVDPADTIYSPGAIAVAGDRIVAVGPADEIVGQVTTARRIDAPRSFVFPGLINTHNHLWQTLLKGLGDDMGLIAWIEATLRPTMPLLDDALCYLGAAVGALEAARCGCTTTLDFMHHIPCTSAYEQIFRAFEDVGGNLVLGRSLRDQLPGTTLAPGDLSLDQQIEHTRELFQKYGRDRVWFAPGTVWGMTEAGLRRVRQVANELGALITIHLNEVAFDSEESQRRFGMRALPFLESIGFLGPDLLCAHCVWSDPQDIHILANHGVAVSYNPVSNMYLGSGVPPIDAMRQAGVRLSLATDGAASNNSQDMIEALKLGALMQKVIHRDATVLTAPQMLRMATVGGADALGRSDLGQLAVGMQADFFIFDPRTPKATPTHDPISTLVYSGGEANVVTTVAAGRMVLDEGRIVNLDERRLLDRVQAAAEELAQRSGTQAMVARRRA
jgi:5-methylthioadenosine/S-adenosylhomocysteine deaminase